MRSRRLEKGKAAVWKSLSCRLPHWGTSTEVKIVPATTIIVLLAACCDPSVVGSRSTEGAMQTATTATNSKHAMTIWNRLTRTREAIV